MLQSNKQPEQREMLKRYSLAQNILQGPNTDIDRYREAMQDFSVLKNRVIGRQITEPLVAKNSVKMMKMI